MSMAALIRSGVNANVRREILELRWLGKSGQVG